MCEWLSRWEWCDVKLLCGGRAFSAHRAVLASVSAFLRRILLSCPIDESPTFIVLPDFDIEAMSSVLYYIYNGEVIIKKDNLETFFDIIKTMQIFIDDQNLPNIKEFTGDFLDLKHNSVDRVIAEKNIFSLKYENCEDQRYVNIKKGQDVMDILLQYSPSDCGINDKRFQNGSERRKANLGNLQPSSYGHRQRNSYLRDLFIETYPQNGNVNGLTTGVLAISNECYRAPSVLLTNANGKHLHDGALSEHFKKITEHISHLPTLLNPGKLLHYTQNDERNHAEIYANHLKSYSCCNLPATKLCTGNWKAETNSLNIQPENIPPQGKSTDSLAHLEQFPFMNFNGKQSDSGLSQEIKRCRLISDADESLDKLNNFGAHFNPNTNKVAILNQVLDNPWNPRMPINYKPFKKKIELESNKPKVEQKLDIGNDTNNNIELSQSINATNIDITCLSETKGNSTNTSPPLILTRDDFKCTVCNQMHTSSESLELHARRHSTGARYSCSECGKTFSQLRNFKYHVSVHRGTREFAATCSVCGKYFNDRGYLSSHMKIHRNRKEYKCSLCPKSFNQRVAYNMHVRIHTGVKPHVCTECGKAFSRKMLLKQHQRTHSGERPYACPHCDKRFADRSNMTLHLRLHTGVKPFSCTLCPKSFTKKHHLKSHLNFHTGSKPYSCPRCQLAFTQSSNMRTHLKKCTAPQPTADTTQTHE